MVEGIKMKLGMQLGVSAGQITLDGESGPPPPKGHSPQFSVHICCGQMAGWIKMPLATKVGLGQGQFVLHGDPAPPSKRGTHTSPNFGPCILWLNGRPSQLLLSTCQNYFTAEATVYTFQSVKEDDVRDKVEKTSSELAYEQCCSPQLLCTSPLKAFRL